MLTVLPRRHSSNKGNTLKKILIGLAVALGITVVAPQAASATHSNVTGTTTCVDANGFSPVSWDVIYPQNDWNAGNLTIVSNTQSLTFNPTVLEKQGDSASAAQNVNWNKTSNNQITLTVKVRFGNGHVSNDSATVARPADCVVVTTTTTVPETTTTTTVPETTTTTTIPETTTTTVPETTTTVPETTTTVPETTIPVTTVPVTTVPVTTIPVTTIPETTVPVTTVPATTTTNNLCTDYDGVTIIPCDRPDVCLDADGDGSGTWQRSMRPCGSAVSTTVRATTTTVAATTTAVDREIPNTGSEINGWMMAAFGLLASGGIILIARRRPTV